MSRGRIRGTILLILLLVTVVFFGWRFTRTLNIFVVDDKFALPFPVKVPEGLTSIRAKDCGACHQEIYEEWQTSMHAKAWTDEYYQVDRAWEDNPPVCDNCHIQLETQRGYLVAGFQDSDRLYPIKEPNPHYDPELQNEGVTCAVCHLREGKIVGPYKTDLAPHPVQVDPGFLAGSSPCHICHVVGGDRWDTFYKRPPCATLSEVEDAEQKPDCVGCHMPPVTRPMAKGAPPREGGKHLFHGGHHPYRVKSALKVEYSREDRGGEAVFTFTLTNVGANHFLPTGTPDRHLTLELKLLDQKNNEIDREEFQMIRRFIWRPFIIELNDSRLPFNEPRTFKYSFDRIRKPQPVLLEATVRYHLLKESRRKRIGYQNTEPIQYPLWQERIRLTTGNRVAENSLTF